MKKPNLGIKICGELVKPGQRKVIHLTSTNLFTHTSISIPVHVICGKKPGPCLLVTAAIHGDELNGVEIIKQLVELKKMNKIKGTLIAVPIMNIFGFIHLSRYLPDRRDLNRSFPGTSKGSLAARIAQIFNKHILSQVTHLIDLHTGAQHRFNLPQIRADLSDEVTLEMAKAFAPPAIINASFRDGSLRSAGARKKIPSLVYEAGEALRLDKVCISLGLKGIINVMRLLEMLPMSKGKMSSVSPVVAKTTQWTRASQSGMFYPRKNLGQEVSKGEVIAKISDPFGQQETNVTATENGIIIGQFMLPLVTEGDALFNIAYFEELKKARKKIKEIEDFNYFDEYAD